ncbi:MAG: hypothetical protein H6734_24260 [Alphaproteobacteria bacterium]|nr:hypothetical protein [Alphaproteobacteria bacterium]
MLMLGCMGLLLSPCAVNEAALVGHSARMDRLLPPSVEVVARLDRVGLQVCCSNHCDFFAGRLVRTDDPSRLELPGVEVLAHGGVVEAPEHMSGLEDLLATTPAGPDLYAVYLFDQTTSGWGFQDLRCH